MNSRYIQVLQKKDGVALMSVILLFTVMILFVGSMSFVSVGNANASTVPAQTMAAFYAAEAGITVAVHDLQELRKQEGQTVSQTIDALTNLRGKYLMYTFPLSPNNGEPVEVSVWFEGYNLDIDTNTMTTKIVSMGQVGERARMLETNVTFTFGSTGTTSEPAASPTMRIRHAVLVKNSISTGNGTITSVNPNAANTRPKIATLSTQIGSINIGSLNFPNGEIELVNPQPVCTNNVVVNESSRCLVNNTILVTQERTVTSPEVRVNFPVINFVPIRTRVANVMSSPANYTTLETTNNLFVGSAIRNGTFYIPHLDFSINSLPSVINVEAGHDVFIVTDRLTLGNRDIQGDGKIVIFVRPGVGSFNPSGTGTEFGRLDKEELLEIYVDDISGVNSNSFHVTFANNSFTKGYLMFHNARVQFNQNAKFNGAIFTAAANGNIDAVRLNNRAHLSLGEGRALIVAANGRVYMNNNSSLNGAVIAHDFVQGNGGDSRVTFDPTIAQYIPFEIITPIQINNPSTNERTLKVGMTNER